MKRPLIRWQVFLWIVACGTGGFAVGKVVKPVSSQADHLPTATRRSERPQPPQQARPEPLDEFRSLLSAESKETDIWKVVSQISPDRIRDALREIRELKRRGTYLPRENEILSALYFQWAENDPKAALAGLPPKPNGSLEIMMWSRLAKSVLTAWMRMDPEAAFGAAKAHTNKDFYYMGRDLLVQTWTPENVFQNLDRHSEHRRDLIGWYSVSIAEKPEARDAMLNILKEKPFMEDADTVEFMLFRAWGYRDFDAAVARAKLTYPRKALKQIIEDNLAMHANKALPCAVENDLPPGGPKWEKGYAEWLGMDGVEARAWFKNLELTWELEGHADAAAAFLALDFANASRMNLATEKADAELRFHQLVERWQTKKPHAVRKWLDTAPTAARDLFKAKADPNGN